MGLSAAAGNPGQAGDRGDAATDEEPHGFVGGRTGEEAREAGADGIEGGKPIDHEHDARDEENEGNDTVHKWIREGETLRDRTRSVIRAGTAASRRSSRGGT